MLNQRTSYRATAIYRIGLIDNLVPDWIQLCEQFTHIQLCLAMNTGLRVAKLVRDNTASNHTSPAFVIHSLNGCVKVMFKSHIVSVQNVTQVYSEANGIGSNTTEGRRKLWI